MTSRSQPDTVALDGAHGEGGGQILRTALTLSAISGRPLRIERIRALRRNPGLAAQHLTAVRAAAALCAADVEGDELGSTCLSFVPSGPVAPGDYVFDVALARELGQGFRQPGGDARHVEAEEAFHRTREIGARAPVHHAPIGRP